MPQERFAGPEYFTEFDPERFADQLAAQAHQVHQDDEAEPEAEKDKPN
ncbi:hypothetical protein [Corynebacterium atypicum]|nr:hypothetical protein [Corynebacterium atypicum]